LSVANGFNRVASVGLDLIGDSLQVFRRTPGHCDRKPFARKTPSCCCAGAPAGADTNDPDNGVARIYASSMSSGHFDLQGTPQSMRDVHCVGVSSMKPMGAFLIDYP